MARPILSMLFALATATFGAAAWAGTAADIEALVRERIAAAARGDKAVWRTHIDDRAVWTGPGLANATTADAELAIAANASLPKQPSEIRDFEVHDFGDTAIASYVNQGGAPPPGEAAKRFRKTDTYVRRDGEWRLVLSVEIFVPAQVLAQADPATFDALAGSYALDATHVVRVWRDGSKLMSQADGEAKATELLFSATDTFVVDGDPGEYVFARGNDGRVDRLLFRMAGSPDIVMQRDREPTVVGAWRLVSYEDKAPDGQSRYPFGREPKGLLLYVAGGTMSIQLMKMPHPTIASGDDGDVTPAEKQALYDAYVAYYGRYTVDAENGVIVHHVEADLADVYIGNDEQRPYVLRGDTLILAPHWKVAGQDWTGVRVFKRAAP
jgi:ketosteroid isomerase-like protein